MMAPYLALLNLIHLTTSYRCPDHEDYNIHDIQEEQTHRQHKHKYPPYYFSRKYFPSFSAWMMTKDEIYISELDYDPADQEDNGERSEKTQLTAFLLSFFLGCLGVGRFYVGSTIMGTVKIVITWAMCMQIFVDISTEQCEFGVIFGFRIV